MVKEGKFEHRCRNIIGPFSGENVLHMSVVAEDPTTVKYLLDQGVNIHERCYGNFMCPEDQKASRSDSLDHEIVDVCTKSNYQG